MNLWTVQQGGCSEGRWQTRAAVLARPLIVRCAGVGVSVQVLETDNVGAFGWPNGHIFVTRGLVDRLNDAELAAAIAHELGHLLDSGKLRIIGELSDDHDEVDHPESNERDPDPEVRADAAGLRLLRADGIPRRAMLSMLKKVEMCGAMAPPYRLAIERRVQLLSARMSADALTDAADRNF